MPNNPPKNDTPDKALVEQCDWPEGGRFTFHDEPGEHDPCYVVMPDGAALPLNHHAGEGVDIARAQFIIAACNAAQHGGLVDARWRPEVVAFADLMEQQLRANDHKPGWKSDTAIELARRLNQESDELWGVLNEMDPGRAQAGDAVLPEQYRELSEQAGREAADVANFAMMIADVCGALPSALASNSPVAGEDREKAHMAAFKAIYGERGDPFQNPETFDFCSKVADAVLTSIAKPIPTDTDSTCPNCGVALPQPVPTTNTCAYAHATDTADRREAIVRLKHKIVQDICELPGDNDPDADDTLILSLTDLEVILDEALIEGPLPAGPPHQGFVLVPVEPTEAMVEAGRVDIQCRRDCHVSKVTGKQVWSAMIAARPGADS